MFILVWAINPFRYWKKQLTIAKDARRVDSLCSRIYLSYRLLDGTSRFQELHEIVKEAKTKLETEVGPLSGVSARMARGIVSRLTVAGEVQALCSTVIAKADEISATVSSTNQKSKGTCVQQFSMLSLEVAKLAGWEKGQKRFAFNG